MKTLCATDPVALRGTAEMRLKARPALEAGPAGADLPRLQHELQLHQIELELQNEELRRSQAETWAALARYTDHFDFAPVGYFNLGADGTILLVNRTGAALVGVEQAQLVGQSFVRLLAEPAQLDFIRFLAVAFCSGAKESCEIKLVQPGRPLFCGLVEATLAPGGQECRLVLIDITERNALEEQLQRAQRLATIGTLAAGVAHDFNNALAPISLSAGLLQDSVVDPAARELLEVIRASAARGSGVVRQMLAFGSGFEGERISVQVPLLVKEMTDIVHGTFPPGVVLAIGVEHAVRSILGDPTQLHRVLMNLCLNARDAMPDGGTLTLSAKNADLGYDEVRRHPPAKTGPYVAITVGDTGTGIPTENMQRIFDPFFTTKVREKGTGLGLAMAAGIVRGHGGFMTVESVLDHGATFTVFLPATESVAAAASVSPEPVTQGRGELILVVDDESLICRMLERTLRKHGYEVVIAGDGTAALATYRARLREISLVLTDVMMPLMGGVALARALHNEEPRLPVIAFSGAINPGISLELKEAGVAEILHKPCGSAELLAAIARQILKSK